MSDRKYGYLPDPQDVRDYRFQHTFLNAEQLPASVDLRNWCSPVRDQGPLGACTGFAMAVGLREFLQEKAKRPILNPMSPLWLYFMERTLEGSVSRDSGAYIRDGLKVLAKNGCSGEKYWPYMVANHSKKPSCSSYISAYHWKIKSYSRLYNLQDIRACLAQNGGVVLGFAVYDSFEGAQIAKTGYMPMPAAGEQVLGGHAVFCCGYRVDPAAPGGGWLIIKNSWGTGWGDKGYFYMPFAFLTPNNIFDLWTAEA